MTDHDKSMQIISELNLSLNDIGFILGCSWQMAQKKKTKINYNKFTSANLEKFREFKENKINKLKSIQ